jgi:hypothetical protein
MTDLAGFEILDPLLDFDFNPLLIVARQAADPEHTRLDSQSGFISLHNMAQQKADRRDAQSATQAQNGKAGGGRSPRGQGRAMRDRVRVRRHAV